MQLIPGQNINVFASSSLTVSLCRLIKRLFAVNAAACAGTNPQMNHSRSSKTEPALHSVRHTNRLPGTAGCGAAAREGFPLQLSRPAIYADQCLNAPNRVFRPDPRPGCVLYYKETPVWFMAEPADL